VELLESRRNVMSHSEARNHFEKARMSAHAYMRDIGNFV
jgi:hypothetical protein